MDLPPVPPELGNMVTRMMSDPDMSARIMNIVNGMNNYPQMPGQSDDRMRMNEDTAKSSGSDLPDLSQMPQMLGRLMSDPQIMGLVGSMMNGAKSAAGNASDNTADDKQSRVREQSDSKPGHLTDNGRRGHDRDRIALLCALKPYLSEGRCRKIEGMIKILELVEFARTAHLFDSVLSDNLMPGMIN